MLTYKEALEKAGVNNLTEFAISMGMSKQNLEQKISYERSFKDYELMMFCEKTKQKPSNIRIKKFSY